MSRELTESPVAGITRARVYVVRDLRTFGDLTRGGKKELVLRRIMSILLFTLLVSSSCYLSSLGENKIVHVPTVTPPRCNKLTSFLIHSSHPTVGDCVRCHGQCYRSGLRQRVHEGCPCPARQGVGNCDQFPKVRLVFSKLGSLDIEVSSFFSKLQLLTKHFLVV